MASPRANWKGYLKVAEIVCPIALYSGATTIERTSFRTVNRATGNAVKRIYVDEKTHKEVAREDQVKGYETDKDKFVILEPEEIAAAVPESDKTIDVKAFVPCREVDTIYFDKPYYLRPDGKAAQETYRVLIEGMKATRTAALAQAVLFRRVRSLMLRPYEGGIVANTLNYDYEVRPANDAFDEVRNVKVEKEMLHLARHILTTKAGEFDPKTFDDRYDAAVAELVRAKIAGKPLPKRRKAPEKKVVDLMAALRESAKLAGGGKTKVRSPNRPAPKRALKKAS